MSEAYNPETGIYERLEAMEVEARQLRKHFDDAADPDDREVLEQQLREVGQRIGVLRHRLHPRSGKR